MQEAIECYQMDKIDNIDWLSAFVIFILFFLIGQNQTQYQVASFGSMGAVVIDQQTGEAWITDSYDDISGNRYNTTEKKFYLKPLSYCDYQKEGFSYKPDEWRNKNNSTWWIWLKRKIGLLKYYN
jgi:hypothetical protein